MSRTKERQEPKNKKCPGRARYEKKKKEDRCAPPAGAPRRGKGYARRYGKSRLMMRENGYRAVTPPPESSRMDSPKSSVRKLERGMFLARHASSSARNGPS